MFADRPVRGAARQAGRLAVVDIGSNSIRLVVFDRPSRAPLPLFNEKVLCGLGRGLDAAGRLNAAGIEPALANLTRFVRLARAMAADRLDLLATAAVRDAVDGPAFVAEVERRCGVRVTVLSGGEEARLSALGVVCGIPDADGLAGDLGGGSLELVALDKGALGAHATLPLGPLRLAEATLGDRAQARAAIDRRLAAVDWLGDIRGRGFYLVGGAWRTLARIHMGQIGYPLRVVHQYAIGRDQAEDLARVIAGLGGRSLANIPGLSGRRLETLPFAALLLQRVLEIARPERVVFSAFGLREGHVFSRLSPDEQREDPLVAACAELADHRFAPLGAALHDWVEPLFPADGPAERRLRLAICHLSDIAWREHPDYRAEQAFRRILHLPLAGIDHAQRAAAALAVAVRYGGDPEAPEVAVARGLLDSDQRRRAIALGRALRLAYSVSGATPDLLRRAGLGAADGRLTLRLPKGESAMFGDAVQRRLEALGRALDLATGLDETG
ncbi:MAG: Ppx/GppA family phosphatase [Dongiaceae bacterium]